MNAENWRYDIQHGPDGEANYAWVYRGQNMVATMKTHDAKAICGRMNTPNPAVNVGVTGTEAAIRKAGQVAIDHIIDTGISYEATADDLADYLTRIVDACVRAALTSPQGEETPAAPAPQGDVVLPTAKMLLAGSMVDWKRYDDKAEAALDVWNAMLRNAPAPQPPSPTIKAPDRDGGGERARQHFKRCTVGHKKQKANCRSCAKPFASRQSVHRNE